MCIEIASIIAVSALDLKEPEPLKNLYNIAGRNWQ
jgi:hypothetical protein